MTVNNDTSATTDAKTPNYYKVTNPISEALLKEWHPTRNHHLDPHRLNAGSNHKVWWLGECGHEWEALICNRGLGRNCPYCSGKRILKGYNDLASVKPLIALQWHPTRNGDLTPEEVNVGSNKKAWWLNPDCGHEWEMKIVSREETTPCSVCYGSVVQTGVNDFATLRPELAKQLHPTKNTHIDITVLSVSSGKKVWWLGECGHEWEAIVRNRTMRNGNDCPICAGKSVLVGYNDFATLNPDLVAEWHPTKNLPLTPEQVTAGSGRKVYWQCAEGHEWKTAIYSRASGKHQCPYCTGRNAIIGVNDLLSVNPVLASEWHPVKNNGLLPSAVKEQSNQNVWWMCHKKHEWTSDVSGRSRGQGCPVCASNRYVSKAEQEIADFIVSQGLAIMPSDKRTIKGMELDIYVPEKKIAIEYNGLYWHSDLKIADIKYHYNKWLRAKEAGIQLIQIWEDELNRNPEQIKAMLLHKLGISQQERIFARKTYVNTVTKSEAEEFFRENHVQGYASGSYYFGLREKATDTLVSVIAFKKEKGNALNIIRYATSKNVVGGFTKLMSMAERTLKPSSFVTFSDNCVSDGSLYANNGFIADKELAPDYRYVVKRERKHKFGYRLKKFREDPNLLWQEGLTERELAKLNGIPRIWDAGKIRWVRKTGIV